MAIAEIPRPILSEQSTNFGQLPARALEIAPADSHEAARLLSFYGNVQGMEMGDYQGAQHSFDRALAIAKREGDAALEMRTLTYAAQVDLWHHRFRESVERSQRATELARAAGDFRTEVGARYWASLALRTIGDLEGLRHQASAILGPAEQLRDRYWLTTAFATESCVPLLEGAWDDARELIDRGLNLNPMDPRLLHERVGLEFQVGNYVQGETFLERMLEVVRDSPAGPSTANASLALASPVAASISGVVSNLDPGEASIAAVLSSPAATPFFTMWARAGASLSAVMRGESDLAEEHYAALKSSPGLLIWCVSSDRLLGLLSQTMGNLDQATGHFEDALTFCRKAGYRPELAWSCCDYANALLAVAPGRASSHLDHQKAMSLLEESLSIATELGMRPLIERVIALQERAETGPVRGPVYPDGLTPREVEVLRLIAAGKSNSEIAEQLFISVNTVARHLTNIYTKTGVANRTEAAIYASQKDFLQE